MSIPQYQIPENNVNKNCKLLMQLCTSEELRVSKENENASIWEEYSVNSMYKVIEEQGCAFVKK
jgi:hypothetical protein